VSNKIYRYETNTGKWVEPTDMVGPAYSNTTAAYVDGPNDSGRIYIPSGDTGNETAFDGHHWVYDIAGSYWMTATSATWPGGTPIAWSAAIANPVENGYYLTGGLSSLPPFEVTAQVHNEVLFYSPGSDTWSDKPAMNEPRYAHSGALVDGRVCVAGGLKADGSNTILLFDGECFDGGNWVRTVEMNTPRYGAGSAVGPDGRWYVFGGFDEDHNAVSVVEYYDPATNGWTAMDIVYDLGGVVGLPARGWPGGGFVGSTLWAIGGNNSDNQALSLVEKVFIPSEEVFLPVAAKDANPDDKFDDTFTMAWPLVLNQPQQRNYSDISDFFDIFVFELPVQTQVSITLSGVPADSNYDLAVYGENKWLWGQGQNLVGINEALNLTLSAGRYYVVVERVSPTGDPNPANYQILVED
jgi:hypothetical protein